MRISATANLGLAVIFGCALALAWVGWNGSQRLTDMLSFVLGPAWSTADGAMMSSIEVGNQQLMIQQMVGGMPLDEVALSQARQRADEELQRVTHSGLVSGNLMSQVQDAAKTYQREQVALLNDFHAYQRQDERLRSNAEALARLSVQMEEMGDSAVEALTSAPDEAITWNGGLSSRWAAADGGMESNIGFLRQLYVMEKMRFEGANEALKKELGEAVSFHDNAVKEMLNTGLFDVPAQGEFSGATLAERYRALLTEHQAQIKAWLPLLSRYQAQSTQYQHSANQFRNLLVTVESEGDKTVDDQVSRLDGIIGQTRNMLIAATLINLLLIACGGLWLKRRMVAPLNEVNLRMHQIASGECNLNARLNLHRSDEVGELANSVDGLLEKLRTIIVSALEQGQTITHLVDNSVGRVTAINQGSQQAANHAEQIHRDSEQMAMMARTISDSCQEAAQNASEVQDLSRRSSTFVGETSEGMHKVVDEVTLCAKEINALRSQAEEIGQIVSTITGISEQTNLLALNAAIEAARAGESGRGFAVVADEVRTLANRTSTSSAEIGRMIGAIQSQTEQAFQRMQQSVNRVENGMQSAEQTEQMLVQVLTAMDNLTRLVHQVAHSTTQLSDTLNHATDRVSSIHVDARQGEEEAQGCIEIAEALHQAITRQQASLSQFRV